MFIQSGRLCIRLFRHNDHTEVQGYASNPDVMFYIPGGALDEAGVRSFLEENIVSAPRNYAVVQAETGAVIGHIVFHPYFGQHTYEIGWVFDPRYCNQGYATEAARAVMDYGFCRLHLHRIIATCQPDNIPSWRVMEKLGMRREGFFKQCIPRGDGGWWDEYYYAVLKEEWDKGSLFDR
ncbi:GNAT family N-acetyltransferase [Paenibacillus sp. GCM10012307]|uniref:GNAT family N-acetyltransferase n=1 Tax=Paenibacillus roseus TaxID=2798579 RepID=A0A934MTD3_9BACL|nr:GNAT family N-acetyltransferase [Paenibacillus roseus]MBJ6359952.1 GNAT family N-acetyltransferase [Paenibacillus roseus]